MVAMDNQWYPRTNNNAHLNVWDYQTSIMGITDQNMPQTSNFLLSSTKSMVARDNQWCPRTNNNAHLNVWDYQTSIMGITDQNMPQSSNFLSSSTKIDGC